MKQTAVEYLSEQIRLTNIEGLRFQLWEAIEQAKEMEKEQQGYSEEEVLAMLSEVRKGSTVISSINNRTYWEFDIKSEKKWFEQFKKK